MPSSSSAAEAFLAWYGRHFPPPPDPRPPAPAARRVLPLTDHELLERARAARNGDRFDRLWRGDCSLYGNDRSRADAALVRHLAFWTDGDPVRIDQLFRCSGLMRGKWDEPRGRGTYGQLTIARIGGGGGSWGGRA